MLRVHHRRTALAAVLVAVLATRCARTTDVTVRIKPPPLDPDGGSAVLDQVYAPTPRCLVFAAAPLGGTDTTVHAVAVRTAAVLPPGPMAHGAPPCLGAADSVVLDGLAADTSYLVELVLLDPSDWSSPAGPDHAASRIVSLQDYPLVGNPSTTYLCLSDPTPSRVFPPVFDLGAALCGAAPEVAGCTLDIPYGGLCPVGTR